MFISVRFLGKVSELQKTSWNKKGIFNTCSQADRMDNSWTIKISLDESQPHQKSFAVFWTNKTICREIKVTQKKSPGLSPHRTVPGSLANRSTHCMLILLYHLKQMSTGKTAAKDISMSVSYIPTSYSNTVSCTTSVFLPKQTISPACYPHLPIPIFL